MQASLWHLTPNRVVYMNENECISSWSFATSECVSDWDFSAASFVAVGQLVCASDERVLYDAYDGRRWQNDTSAEGVEWLTPDDVIVEFDARYPQQRPYWLKYPDDDVILRCESRTVVRLKRLRGNGASQLIAHA